MHHVVPLHTQAFRPRLVYSAEVGDTNPRCSLCLLMLQAIPLFCIFAVLPSLHKLMRTHASVSSMTLSIQAECYCSATIFGNSVVSRCRAVDYSSFGPLVFPLLKLFFDPHPFGGQRRLLDTTPSEANAVARRTGLQLYKDDLFFSLDSVQVFPEACQQLLRQLHALVNTIVQQSAHPFDRYQHCPHAGFP